MKKMDKVAALKAILFIDRKDRPTANGYNKLHRALVSLVLSESEVIEMEVIMEYRTSASELQPFVDSHH
jgi:hypothetical protein